MPQVDQFLAARAGSKAQVWSLVPECWKLPRITSRISASGRLACCSTARSGASSCCTLSQGVDANLLYSTTISTQTRRISLGISDSRPPLGRGLISLLRAAKLELKFVKLCQSCDSINSDSKECQTLHHSQPQQWSSHCCL